MKILHTADWHIGQFKGPVEDGVNLRSLDTVKCLEFMVETAKEVRPDLVCVSGDIFHQEQIGPVRYSDEMVTATRIIEELAESSKFVIVMRGTPNHDGSGQFRVLTKMLEKNKKVAVITTPQVISTPIADVSCIPGFDKQEFRARFPGLSSEEENTTWTQYISDVVMGLRAQCSQDREKPSILMAHYKIRNLYNLEEAVIIAIFDNLSPNYEYIKKLLVSTGLMERLQYDTLVKIKFKKDSIQDFLTVFSPAKPDELLGVMGGYTDKPFNCTNYLRNYYFENECKQTELSVILSGHHFLGGIKGRLKNILYFITLNNRSDRRDDEAYYFAILCCSAPNKDVRCLAMKLLYEIVSSRTVFKKRLIEEYKIFTDFYIKEAIIFVLSKVKYNDVDILKFFEKLIKEERNLSAKSIKRIAEYFGDEYGYIRWNRENLYGFKQDAIISDFIDDLLLTVDLMNKEFLPFRYWGKDHIDMHTKFLKNDKHIIGDINNYLEQKYQCVRTGDCNGSVAFERRIMAEISPKADIETLDMNSFFESYEVIIKKLFNHYQVTNKKTERHMREEDFHDSVYMKCVDIATGLYYGSLMCNYYTNQFATYNNNQRNIGYEVYDPLEYGEEVALTSPVPTYQDFVERLGEYIIKNIEVPDAKDLIWAKNVKLTRKNVLNLLKPLEIKHNEWVMLAGRISLHEDDKYETKWRDTYDIWCCTSPEETIIDDGNARYLTIELDEYSGSLRDYVNCTVRSWLCKDVKNISNQSDVFDETSLVLPPAELIRYFNLEVNVSDLSWNTSDGIKVVICNNNKNSYYKDPIGGTVFIRKDYLDKYLESHTLKYFAFTERFIPETGYADETALHFEIQDGNIIVEILNNGKKRDWQSIVNPSCEECPYGVFEQNNRERNDWQNTLNEILELYGIDEENMPLF